MLSDSERTELAVYRSIFDQAMIGTAHLSRDGVYLWVNSAFASMLGYRTEELTGMSIRDLNHPDDQERAFRRIEELMGEEVTRTSVDRRCRHKDGHYVWLNVTSRLMRDEQGRPDHIVGVVQDVSERKRQELEARRNEERLNAIFEAVEDVVWSFSATEYKLLFINERASRQLYGRSATEFYSDPDLWVSVVKAEDREHVSGIWTRLAAGGFSEDFYRIVRADGAIRWVQARAWCTLDPDGKPLRFEGVVRDVTESRNAELALRDSEARLRLVMESGRMGVWEYNPSTGKAEWSKVLRDILGVGDAPASPERIRSLVHDEDLARYDRDALDLGQGRSDFAPFRICRPDGQVRWVQNIGKVIRNDDDQDPCLIGVIVDMTVNVEAERTIRAQREKMEAASKMSALGVMAGGMAHEINNPVAIIHGNATLLQHMAERGNVAPSQMAQAARVIAQTAERISKITRSLLAFARDSGGDPFKRVPVRELLDETADLCRQRCQSHGVDFHIEPVDPSLEAECQPVQISQVLLNLFNNAHDAVESRTERWIRVSAADAGDFVEIYVTDSGPGIPRELREKVFQPFFTTKEVGRGTGLGLSVASGILEAHGGALRLDDRSSRTRFVVRLPKRQREQGKG